MVNWSKDRARSLKKRARPESHDEQQQFRAASHFRESKYRKRSRAPRNGGEALQLYELNKRGTGRSRAISFGHQGRIEIAVSKAWTNRFGAQAAGIGSGFLKRTWSRRGPNVRRTQPVNFSASVSELSCATMGQ
jgi:hypothetical protein